MWYVIIAIFGVLIIYIYATFNSVIKLENRVREAFATMDVYLKKRWDLIPNLVEVVKGYATHEKDTLTEVIGLRSGTYDNMSNDEKIRTNEQLTKGISKIVALAESYPDLKASENFQKLSENLVKVEDEIANSRKYYNGIVRMFNNKVQVFPNVILTSMFGIKPKLMFEANDYEKENVKIEL